MKILTLLEAQYNGNLGIMELSKFYAIATPRQKHILKSFLTSNRNQQAWKYIQRVTKMKLNPLM